jgi:hypothetical protein
VSLGGDLSNQVDDGLGTHLHDGRYQFRDQSEDNTEHVGRSTMDQKVVTIEAWCCLVLTRISFCSTFLYLRLQQNPKHYAAALTDHDGRDIDWQNALDEFLQVRNLHAYPSST